MEREIKTARMSAVPLFIFITTTLAEREREREVTKFHERSRYNSLVKLTIKKFFFFFLHYKNTRACKVRKSRSEKKTKTGQKIPNPDAEPSIEKAHSQIKIRLVLIGQRHTVVGL